MCFSSAFFSPDRFCRKWSRFFRISKKFGPARKPIRNRPKLRRRREWWKTSRRRRRTPISSSDATCSSLWRWTSNIQVAFLFWALCQSRCRIFNFRGGYPSALETKNEASRSHGKLNKFWIDSGNFLLSYHAISNNRWFNVIQNSSIIWYQLMHGYGKQPEELS